MSRAIAIMGESGSGKTTAMRTLNPDETYYIDCDGKGLSWKGWRNQYNAEKKNYLRTDNQNDVLAVMRGISDKRPNIKNIVIDTINSIMIADERRRQAEKNYDKWADLAWSIYGIIDYCLEMRDDLTVVLIAHVQLDRDDDGYKFAHIKTSGKKLDKIGIETKLTSVLYSKAIPDGENTRYIFETRAMNSTAKTPRGAFENLEIPNDICAVIKKLEEY